MAAFFCCEDWSVPASWMLGSGAPPWRTTIFCGGQFFGGSPDFDAWAESPAAAGLSDGLPFGLDPAAEIAGAAPQSEVAGRFLGARFPAGDALGLVVAGE